MQKPDKKGKKISEIRKIGEKNTTQSSPPPLSHVQTPRIPKRERENKQIKQIT